MSYEKWAEPIHDNDHGKCDECDVEAVATIFEPCMDSDRAAQRRVGRLCKQCLSYHDEIYDTIYEDMCISGMTIERIKAAFAERRS
ncbi:MAG: hypothetical protein GXP25_19140 [Planctomycetes bacterium]|nr:hypothetical protein [Planctomycetota bacterium]